MIPWSNKLAWFEVFKVSLVQPVFRTWAQCPTWTTPTTRFSSQLWINVVQHVLSKLKRIMLSFPRAFNALNLLEYCNQRLKQPPFRPKRVCVLHRKIITAAFVDWKASTCLLHIRNLIYFGRFPFNKKSGLKFGNFTCSMERYIPVARTRP